MAEYRLIESGHRDIYPDVAKTADEVVAAAELAGFDMQTLYGSTTFRDHNLYTCVDYMISHLPRSKQNDAGDFIADYFLRNRSRLGLRFMIWNRRVIRAYDKPGIPAWSWAHYTGSNPHTDHVHAQVEENYTYRPPSRPPQPEKDEPSKRRGALYSTAKNRTWARAEPHARKPEARRPKGFVVRIVATKTTRKGVKWGRASGGLWYRMDALERKLPGALYVTTAALNARKGPGLSHRIVRTWPRGTTLRITETKNGWAQGTGGLWQSAAYLKRK